MIRVTGLRVVPVKGLAALSRRQVRLEADGVAEDRWLFLLHADGAVVTLRRRPQLARVVPDLDLAAGTLTVTFPDGTGATCDLAAAGERVSARLFGKDRHGRVVPGPVADALSDFVGERVRLVLAERTGVGWDEGPVSVLGRASAEAVRTPPASGRPAPTDAADTVGTADPVDTADTARYRMLVEVDGGAPYQEDSWVGRQVRVGETLLHVTHALERCVVIDHDPATGAKDWPGLRALAAARGRDRMTLGVIARVETPGPVRVGDDVEPLGAGHALAP